MKSAIRSFLGILISFTMLTVCTEDVIQAETVTPEVYDFGDVKIGEASTVILTVSSSRFLDILGLYFSPSSSPDFSVSDAPDLPFMRNVRHINYITASESHNKIFFAADDLSRGNELWMSDGIEENTELVKDIAPGEGSSNPKYLTEWNGQIFFFVSEPGTEQGLWVSDGTESGTVLVKNFDFISFLDYGDLTPIGDVLYFRARTADSGRELWKTDGTEAGTVMVKDINPGEESSTPDYLAAMNGRLFFAALDEAGIELWVSDGTEGGTYMVRDIYSGVGRSLPRSMAVAGGILYFEASSSPFGRELWKSDGTFDGTVMVKDINPGGSSITLGGSYLVTFNEKLFFAASDGSTGRELWMSDGTEVGTVPVKDILPGPDSSNPSHFTVLNDKLFFNALSAGTGRELWVTDGTEAGTVMVKDINEGEPYSSPSFLTPADGVLFFTAAGDLGVEVWVTDGTEVGTVQVSDIVPGPDSSSPRLLTWFNGLLFFAASDGSTGEELWKSDGTDEGTTLLKDIMPGGDDLSVDIEITYMPSNGGDAEAYLAIACAADLLTVHLSGTGVSEEPEPLEVIAEILSYFDSSISGGTLSGSGPGRSAEGRRNALRNMIEASGDLIEDGDYEGACGQLMDAYKKCDGTPIPPDFVEGDAAPGLAQMLLDLMASLGC